MKKYIKKSGYPTEEIVKVCIIKASESSGFKEYKKSMLGIPQNIFSLAACTPDWVQIQMVDETVDIKVDYKTDADIMVIMFSTPDAVRGYRIADKFRKKGKTVVLGGLHPTFMQEEASEHADSLLIGECEGIWENLLEDWVNGSLKEKYVRSSPLNLKDLKPYPTDIIPAKKYDYSWTVVVSRGCTNNCSYCTVHNFFPSHRKRPIPHIVEEIKNCGTDFIELKADNLTLDREYAMDLFKAISSLNIIWFTSLEPRFADDRELVEAAAESGLRNVLLGIETPSAKSLSEANKEHLQLEKVKEQIRTFHRFDIEVDSAMLFGFDDHDETIWQKTLDFALEIDLDTTHGVVPIPFPGTALFNNLEKDGRLLTRDWSKYEGSYLVYKHPVFKMNDMYKGIMWYEKEFNKKHKKHDFKWKHRWGSHFNW